MKVETLFKHNDMVLVSITFPTVSEARRFSKKLVKQRLAACVNIRPIESIYWWKGKLVLTHEATAEAKTVNGKVSAIKRFVQKYHSDQTPALIVTAVHDTLPSYRKWVATETHKHARS
ncbi:MAG: divalent cation tolerance protein CutA [Parcubacteria group bacterium]